MNWIVLCLDRVLHGQSSQSVLVYNFTNMHAMSCRSDFLACSGTVNIIEPAGCNTVTLLSAVFPVGLPSLLLLTAMSDSKSLNTFLLGVMIASKNKCVLIHDLSDLTLQIIFDAWWASMNVDSKRPIAWNNSGHVPSWWFHSHYGIEKTSSPGIICIVCHQVLHHPSEHGISSMGKYLLPKAHIAKLKEFTKSEITELTSLMVNETTLPILKRHRSRVITMVSWQSEIISDVRVIPYWPKWQTQCSKLAVKIFETYEFHQDTWNHYLKLKFVPAHIPRKVLSHLVLQQSYRVLCDDLVLLSATALSNICRMEYALTVDAIKKQLLTR